MRYFIGKRKSMILIRKEKPSDIEAIRNVNQQAFNQVAEVNVIDKLRQSCDGLLSLVAELDDQVVGHILFSPATIEINEGTIQGMGLAPMAVLPDYQNQGTGSKLVNQGLALLRDRNCPFVIVLGHPKYYPRFEFELASKYNIQCQWDGVPDEAFMILMLDEKVMIGVSGIARYRDEFSEAL
jgi:putative acetyltransferase